MKIRYFSCHLQNDSTHKKFRVNLLPLLNKFCRMRNSIFKNSFSHNGEKVFLIKAERSTFVFIKTKDTEIIKAIDKTEISTKEITDKLEANESIGFASYLYIGNGYIAYASTHNAPTILALSVFLNTLLVRLRFNSHSLHIMPIAESITRDEALQFAFIGASRISVNRTNTIFGDLMEVIGLNEQEAADISTFELHIRPARKKNIKPAIKKVLAADQNGMEKFEIRAKAEIYDKITDFRIENSLIESDEIKINSNEDLATAIIRTIEARTNLSQKVKNHEEDNEIESHPVDGFIELHSNSDWGRLIRSS